MIVKSLLYECTFRSRCLAIIISFADNVTLLSWEWNGILHSLVSTLYLQSATWSLVVYSVQAWCPSPHPHWLIYWSRTIIKRKTSNVWCTIVGNKLVDHSDVVRESPVGAAPTTSSFSTKQLASIDSSKTPERRDEKHLSLGIWCVSS